MNILMTGATSKIGKSLLLKLLENPYIKMIACLGRSKQKLKSLIADFSEQDQNRLRPVAQDLDEDLESMTETLTGQAIDLVIHVAAVTHSDRADSYYVTNYEATLRLAMWSLQNHCKNFCFVSSQTAGLDAGEYALSKFLAEKTLISLPWQRLWIVRPPEVMAVGGNEGLDKFENLARQLKVYPVLLDVNWKAIVFHPLGIESLLNQMVSTLFDSNAQNRKPIKIILNFRGPRKTAWQLARLAWKNHRAIPIPVYLPLLAFLIRIICVVKPNWVVRDQLPRLLGRRLQNPWPNLVQTEDVEIPTSLC